MTARITRRVAAVFFTAVAWRASETPAVAQTPSTYYAGKEITLLISHPPGGGYDAYARLFARHLAKHVPGAPNVVTRNMPGAAGVLMANYMASQALNDGSVIGLGPGSIATAALFHSPGARYDARKFTWIGSLNSEVAVSVSWKTSPVKTAADLFTKELIVAGAGATDQSVVYPNALHKILGARFKVIPGYGGSSETALALERGEVAGIGGWNYSSIAATRPDWLRDGSINLLVQLSLARHPDLPDTPTVLELGRTDDERGVLKLVFAQSAMGRAIFAPPDLAEEPARVLRAAFRDVVADPDFIADARKSNIEINQHMDADAVQRLIGDLHGANASLVQRAAAASAASN